MTYRYDISVFRKCITENDDVNRKDDGCSLQHYRTHFIHNFEWQAITYICRNNTEYTTWDTCNQSMNNRLAYYQCKLSVYMIRIISTVHACLPRCNRCSFKLFAWLHTTSRTSSETSHQHLRELLEWHHNAITNSGIGERDCYHTSAKWGAFGDFVAIAFYFIIFQCSKVSFIEK